MLDIVNLLKLTAIGASFFAAGGIVTVSVITMPCILMSPPGLAILQWRRVYVPGKIMYPAICALSAASYITLALKFPEKLKILLTCAALTIGVLPYTGVTMLPINLYLMAVKDYEKEQEKIMKSIRSWNARNFFRTFLPLSAAIIGYYNTLKLK